MADSDKTRTTASERWYEQRTFAALPREAAARFGDREALVFGDERFTHVELAASIDEAARGFMALGVERGQHVALWLNNRTEWLVASWALARIGAVQVLINTRLRTRDVSYVLNQSDATMLVTHDVSGPVDYLGMVREVMTLPDSGTEVHDAGFPCLRRVVIVGAEAPGTSNWQDLRAASAQVDEAALEARARAVQTTDPVFIMYTSGTTGRPKGAVHTHQLIRNVEERGFRMAMTTNDTILNYLPLFHAFGYSEGALMSMLMGSRQVLTEIFDPDECLDLIERERVTVMHGFEAHMKGLTEAQERRSRNLASLRTGIFAAGMLSAVPVARRGARVLAPLKAISGFGMTEVWLGAALCSIDDDETHRTETSGYPALGYEVRIVDAETGLPCAPYEPGELQVRGYSLMRGYYKKPDETAAAYTDDGWFKTGDTAHWCEDGYMRFMGRYKDMLKIGGENVDPTEVEELLLERDEVHQVAVVGLPDERLSEVAVAYVQATPGTNLTEATVIGFCRGQVASFKVPRHVVFVDEFPMTASGKIRKVDLREQAKRDLLAGPAVQ
ncbi:MAG: AMP-binding protein [Pseudomonadota bacterium]